MSAWVTIIACLTLPSMVIAAYRIFENGKGRNNGAHN